MRSVGYPYVVPLAIMYNYCNIRNDITICSKNQTEKKMTNQCEICAEENCISMKCEEYEARKEDIVIEKSIDELIKELYGN